MLTLKILNLLILSGVITVIVIMWRIRKKCPKCGKRMAIAYIQLICKQCGFAEGDFNSENH